MKILDVSKSFTIMLIGVIGFWIGYGILMSFIPSDPAFIKSEQGQLWLSFSSTDGFRLWLALICMQTTLWAIFSSMIWVYCGEIKKKFDYSRAEVNNSILVFLLICVIGVFAGKSMFNPSPLPNHYWRTMVLHILGIAVILMALRAIWVVHSALNLKVPSNNNPNAQELSAERLRSLIRDFIQLRGYTQKFLSILGVILGLAILATGALRSATLAANPNAKWFSPQVIILYGLFGSAIVALAYAPTYLTFKEKGEYLLDSFFPLPPDNSVSWDNWNKSRTVLENLLQLRLGSIKTFQVAAAILSPLLGSVISVLLGRAA
jgi:hypothetical protein